MGASLENQKYRHTGQIAHDESLNFSQIEGIGAWIRHKVGNTPHYKFQNSEGIRIVKISLFVGFFILGQRSFFEILNSEYFH